MLVSFFVIRARFLLFICIVLRVFGRVLCDREVLSIFVSLLLHFIDVSMFFPLPF